MTREVLPAIPDMIGRLPIFSLVAIVVKASENDNSISFETKNDLLMDTYRQETPPNSDTLGTLQWEDLSVGEQDHLLLSAFEDNERRWAVAETLGVKSGTAGMIFTNVYAPGYPIKNDEQRRQRERVSLAINKGSNLAERLQRAIDRRDGQAVFGPEPPILGRVSQPVADPNSLSYGDTWEAFNEGEIGFFVDQGRAPQAIASGIPIGATGVLAVVTAPSALIIGIGMAMFVGWWWLFVGGVVAVWAFKLARRQAVTAVRRAALTDESVFYALRRNGMIWFELPRQPPPGD